ncbi:MAG: fumarylacetoacetate hydrolase family protein [Candidatus Sumerlaeota bacterium]
MRLVYFSITADGAPRLGVETPLGIMEAETVCRLYCLSHSVEISALPGSPLEYLNADDSVQILLRKASDWAMDNDSEYPTVLSSADRVTLLAPIPRPGKIICVGHNYRDHCVEQNAPIPKEPVIFAKFPSCVQYPGADVVRPAVTREMDYEAELGVVIGRAARNVTREDALDYVGGYVNLNDVTARDLQRRDTQWIRAKSADTFAPMGPCLVTPEDFNDPQEKKIQMRLNGKVMQDSNTSEMIFSVARLIEYISQFTTLEPGDVIATGTPPGVGGHREPPVFLDGGDVMEVEVEGLGVLRNTVRV